MGRTSKFLFPMPGRRHATTTTREDTHPVPIAPATISNHRLSKAQRILGTDSDLNIDAPIRETVEDYSWRHVGSRSSGMSFSISESTQSTNENGSVHESQSEQWDRESGVLPNDQRLHGKPSSTLLGLDFGDESATSSARLRHNDSSSTLKYYDRQKSPLSISQQTSASSARDLALRKGFPPVHQRSPLLYLESSIDQFEENFREKDVYMKEADMVPDKMHKKPTRLDLSMLFPRSRRHGSKSPADSTSSNASPSSTSTNNSRTSGQPPDSSRRKLKKVPSKESIHPQGGSVRTTRSHDPQTLSNRYDHYEHLPVRAPHMDRIPEASIPDRLAARAKKDGYLQSKFEQPSKSSSTPETYHEYSEREPFSWKNVRSSMMISPYDTSSAASISSRNTKTSRHTATSILSHSDLKDKSVLSLSSDSEGEMSDPEPARSHSMVLDKGNYNAQQAHSRTSLHPMDNRRQPQKSPGGLTTRIKSKRHGDAGETSQNLLTIPETTSRSSHVSPTWQQPRTDQYERRPEKQHRVSMQKEKRTSRQPPSSVKSGKSHHEPTPPISPTSMEFRQTPDRESRFMAVTKQEEALLEALRQKRARMREEIIEEHETNKTPSPTRIPERSASRYSSTSTTNTIRGPGNPHGNQRVLLYLDTPLSLSEAIDASEPSPDLSDFLSFGSDENSTPRNSWAPSSRNVRARPDSFITPHPRVDNYSPETPPSAARLSAVGAAGGLVNKKRSTAGVRFVDDGKVNTRDYLLDDHESGVIWGM